MGMVEGTYHDSHVFVLSMEWVNIKACILKVENEVLTFLYVVEKQELASIMFSGYAASTYTSQYRSLGCTAGSVED